MNYCGQKQTIHIGSKWTMDILERNRQLKMETEMDNGHWRQMDNGRWRQMNNNGRLETEMDTGHNWRQMDL